MPPELIFSIFEYTTEKPSEISSLGLVNHQFKGASAAQLISQLAVQYNHFYNTLKADLESKQILYNELLLICSDLQQLSETQQTNEELKNFFITKFQDFEKKYPFNTVIPLKNYIGEWKKNSNHLTSVKDRFPLARFFTEDIVNLLKRASLLIEELSSRLSNMQNLGNMHAFLQMHKNLYTSFFLIYLMNSLLEKPDVLSNPIKYFPLGLKNLASLNLLIKANSQRILLILF